MIRIHNYSGKHVAVFGLGRAGASAVKSLVHSEAIVFAWDDNTSSIESLKSQVKGVTFAEPKTYDWNKISTLVLSPGIPLTHPAPHEVVKMAKEHNCQIICDIELLQAAAPEATYIGITGTNGKSTTTALIGHIAMNVGKVTAVGGNIGTAASQLPHLDKDGVYIIEASSYQLDLLLETKFNISVLLNITPDHLDRHGGMDGYIAAKKNIFNSQGAEDFAVIAVDDDYTLDIYNELKNSSSVNVIPVSSIKQVDGGVFVNDTKVHNAIRDDNKILELGGLKKLPGRHNRQNIAAAFAVLKCLGCNDDEIVNAIRTFPGLAHRMEHVAEVNGITFVNDSKATNAVAAEKSLSSFNNIIWIAGGVPKAGGIDSLIPCFGGIKHVCLIGESEDEFAQLLEGKIPFDKCANMQNAFDKSVSLAKVGDVVLLSPACASFDQYKSFEARGEDFCKMVKAFKEKSNI